MNIMQLLIFIVEMLAACNLQHSLAMILKIYVYI